MVSVPNVRNAGIKKKTFGTTQIRWCDMAKVFWVSQETECGGVTQDIALEIFVHNADVSTMRNYVHWWRKGYEMEWQPPEWILDIFPPA